MKEKNVKEKSIKEKNVKEKNMKGKIKWFNLKKGYGFIVGEDGKDIFVHKNDMPAGSEINNDDPVEYEIEATERGPQAKNVKKL